MAAPQPIHPDHARLFRLKRLLTWLAATIAIVIAVAVPVIYLLTAHKYETLRVERAAQDLAETVSGFVYSHPDLWEFSTNRLESILLSRARDEQLRQLIGPNGDIIAVSQSASDGGALHTPNRFSIEGSAEVFNGQIEIGTIRVAESLAPVLIATGWIAVFGTLLATAVFVILRALPLRALDNALNHLQRAHADLRARVARHEQAEAALLESEERFRSVVNNSPTKIHIKDVEGRYLLINSEAEKLFGVTEEEAKGKTSHDIFPDKQADDFRTHDQVVLDTGQVIEQEEQWELDGVVRTYLTVKFPIRDGDSEIVAIGAIGTDITERKRAEEVLRDSRDRIRLIADNLPILISYFDNEQRIHFGNKTLEEWYARPAEEILGRTIEECVGPKGFERMSARLEAANSGTPQHYEHTTTYPDGINRTVDALYVPHIDEAGTVQGCFAFVQDITERKAGEEAVLAAMEKAEIANRAKSEFLANMSHELRTPLNAIIGFSDIIKDERLGPVGNTKYRDYAGDINESGQHLLCLINDILDLSKVESGTDELCEENTDIPKTVRSIVRLLTGAAQTRNVDLVSEVPDGIAALRADARKLKQILVNLLSNAIKFTPDGGKVTLKIWSSAESGFVFQVIDTGIGIALEDIPKALAPFQQIDSGLNRRHEGTGLGLPLTKSLVELHGGSLELQSEAGVGTTVTVRFPAERIIGSPHDTEALSAGDRKAG